MLEKKIMINRINPNSVNSSITDKKYQPQFKGLDGILTAATSAIQLCEVNPMVNVSVLDLSTAIIPRTVVESETNPYAGFEAFRRESSGLIINCLIPGLIVAGIAKMIGSKTMGGKTAMSDCWADKNTIDMVTHYWKDAKGTNNREKIEDTIKQVLNNTEGVDGKTTVKFKDFNFGESVKLIADEVEKQSQAKPQSIVESWKYGKQSKENLKTAFKKIVEQTKAAENIKITGLVDKDGKAIEGYFNQSVKDIIQSFPKLLHELSNNKSIKVEDFANNAKKLVTAKSLLGLGVIIPLALSAQPINRWITEKTSGKKGAPIYKDFSQSQSKELSGKETIALNSQKLVSVTAMIGVAALSIMKKPSEMFKSLAQFKGIFPSMDQARLISTATFASRMMASEDKNDLREATVRDIATFSAFYFLGDYVAKGIASAIQKFSKDKTVLINIKKELKANANTWDKIKHWTKDTALKSSDELIGNVKGQQMRAVCQIGNIAFSLVALGLLIPKLNRKKTDQEREKELKQMGVDQNTIDKYYPAFEMNMNDNSQKNVYNAFFTSKP